MALQTWRHKNADAWYVVALDDGGRVTDAAGPLWPAALEAIAGTDPARWPDIEGDAALAGALEARRDDYNVMGAVDVLDAILTAAYAKDQMIGP